MCRIAEWIPFVFLALGSVFDCKKKELPLWVLLLFSTVTVVLAICCPLSRVWDLIAGVFIGILMLFVSKITREAIGYGDSWITLLLGIRLGGEKLLQVLFVASLLAGICSVLFLWKRKWKKSATLPFVPFLALAYLGGILI